MLTIYEKIAEHNSTVTPCAPLPKLFGVFNRDPHDWVDITGQLPTVTYTWADMCRKCKLIRSGSGI